MPTDPPVSELCQKNVYIFQTNMKITPVEHDLQLAVSSIPRSPGLHMSDIYGSLYKELEPNRFKDGPMDLLKLEAGLTLEAIFEEGLKRRLIERPGEFTTEEGIIYTPDLLIFNHVTRLGEIKLTWMSMHQGIEHQKFDKWFCQMKSYCYHLQTPYARLYAFFVNGNYRPSTPAIRAWDIEFTAQELRDNWACLINHAKHKRLL